MTTVRNILVLGGTGFVGRALCVRLVERNGGGGGRIVVATRRLPRGNAVRSLPTVELAQADVHDDRELAGLLDGIDAVVNLVAILHGNASAFERVHVALPRRLAQACQVAGVRRVIHVSALGVGPDAPSNYLRTKTEGEAALRAASLDLTVLRPSVMFGAEDRFLNLFASIQAIAPIVPLAGSDAHFQPVWVDDVATAIARCLDLRPTIGQTYECFGPGTYSLSELVRLAGRWSGRERHQIALPGALGRLQALSMEWLPGTPLMSRDNLDSMKRPNVASGTVAGMDALGIHSAALEAVAPGYLGNDSGRARLEKLRHAPRS